LRIRSIARLDEVAFNWIRREASSWAPACCSDHRALCGCTLGVWGGRCLSEEVRGDRTGERASAQKGFVVAEPNAIADARAEAGSLELPVLDPTAHGLLVGTDASGDVGDGQYLVGTLHIRGDGLHVAHGSLHRPPG
jgi:hypothetical protein